MGPILKPTLPTLAQKTSKTGQFPQNLRILGHSLTVAREIEDLEACLALERASSAFLQSLGGAGIFTPPAVPYCDFLMLHDAFGRLLAICRLMRLGRENPISNPLESTRFHLSPLLTALRYSREGVLEMGAPIMNKDVDPERAARLLWQGVVLYMERNNLGFIVGSDILTPAQPGNYSPPELMNVYGLHPDLEVETLSKFRKPSHAKTPEASQSGAGSNPMGLPPGVYEALRRGCRLAAEPSIDKATGSLEFIWVSFREMLLGNGSG